MSCATHETALGDYVDGTLQGATDPADVAARDALVSHLAGCARCRALVEDLRAIRTAARGLETLTPPSRLWTRIAAEADARRRRPWWRGLAEPRLQWRWLAASAAMVALVSALVWVAWRQPVPDQVAELGAGSTGGDPVAVAPATMPADPEMQLAEQRYAEAIAGLEELAAADTEALDAETADVLQASLTVIDDAIGESRAALASEPDSELAQASLFDALRTKVALLQDTVALINEMRKGNQEGAARIVTELNQ